MKRSALRSLACGLVLIATLGSNVALAERWLSGASLQRQLARELNLVWSDHPLRGALEDLSRAQGVAVLIDRRVDPDRRVSLALEQVPLAAALAEIGRREQLGYCLLGPVAYFGPPRVASRLRTLAALRTDEARRLPADARGRLLQARPLVWDDFTVPRELLRRVAGESGIEIDGLERVPQDLWAAADLPPLSLVDRITLIAVQYDLTFQVGHEQNRLSLVPLPEDVALVRSYEGGSRPQAVAERYAAIAPSAQIKVVGSKVFVKGLLEEHERIAAGPKSPKRSRPRGPAQEKGTIRIEKLSVREVPVEQLLQELGRKLQLDFQIDREALQAAGISLEHRISLNVQGVTVDELLDELAKRANVQLRRHGDVVELGPVK